MTGRLLDRVADVLLVHGHPVLDAPGEVLEQKTPVALEGVHGAAVEPAAVTEEGKGRVEVEEAEHGLDTVGDQAVHEIGRASCRERV